MSRRTKNRWPQINDARGFLTEILPHIPHVDTFELLPEAEPYYADVRWMYKQLPIRFVLSWQEQRATAIVAFPFKLDEIAKRRLPQAWGPRGALLNNVIYDVFRNHDITFAAFDVIAKRSFASDVHGYIIHVMNRFPAMEPLLDRVQGPIEWLDPKWLSDSKAWQPPSSAFNGGGGGVGGGGVTTTITVYGAGGGSGAVLYGGAGGSGGSATRKSKP